MSSRLLSKKRELEEYYTSDLFQEVKAYIRYGVPEDHFCREDSNDSQSKGKVWLDSSNKDYQDYPPEIVYSARFRDGLTADRTIYSKFSEDFSDAVWITEFLKHSKVVYGHLNPKDAGGESDQQAAPTTCTESGLHVYSTVFITQSGHKGSLCMSAIERTNFLLFCMKHIEGYQSQTLMRSKLFIVLDLEVTHLNKKWTKKHKDVKLQAQWVHALQVTLSVLMYNETWLLNKFHGEDDMDYLFEELLPRCKQALSHLKVNNVFDNPASCKVLISIVGMMHSVEKSYLTLSDYMDTESRQSLFGGLIKTYAPVADELYRKHHGPIAEELDLTFCQAESSGSEEDDENEDDDEKEDEVEEVEAKIKMARIKKVSNKEDKDEQNTIITIIQGLISD
jgi:hypothetical protein